jgi:hypothetical protein
VVDADEKPAMPEVAALMKHAKEKIALMKHAKESG